MSLQESFVEWIVSQDVSGLRFEKVDDDHLRLSENDITAQVVFYDLDGSCVCELLIERDQEETPLFFLHFDLQDLERAKQLFDEMCEVLKANMFREVRHVMLCCTCGITTTFFAYKLNETAQELHLDFDFCAKAVEVAMEVGNTFSAILLAPQVGHMLDEVRRACPNPVVLVAPARLFGSYDAPGTLLFIVNALTGAKNAAASDLRMARDVDRSKRILAISYVHREDEPTLSFRIMERGEMTHSGMLVLRTFNAHALRDLAAYLSVKGIDPTSFDAVGLAVPGEVRDGIVTRHRGNEVSRRNFANILKRIFKTRVRVDSNACAAAAGAYITQNTYDDVCFHAQAIGDPGCKEGFVIAGRPHVGKGGFSGTLTSLARHYSLRYPLEEAAWRVDGVVELVAHYLAAAICTMAPEAIFVWCDLIADMGEVRDLLAATIPDDVIPDLIPVTDYDGLTLVGELALCLQDLAAT